VRTLIVGAGVAGVTLAALMSQRGEEPLVIERDEESTEKGYMLGLLPIGGRVLHGLGLHGAYRERSVAMRAYRIGNGRGELVREYDLTSLARRFGDIRGIGRDELVELLLEGATDVDIRHGTTVEQLEPRDEEVGVVFDDGSQATFDLVVGADGLHSDLRGMILDDGEYSYRDTGWGGWVFWTDPDLGARDAYAEYWGAGRFLGLYPTRDRLGVFLGGPADEAREAGLPAFAAAMRRELSQPIPALERIHELPEESFFWEFHDCRAARWRRGRVVLLGDAAVGFLPTAGVGASMAMESAAALDDTLSRTGPGHVEQALDRYEKRHRQRVERAQADSRRLGRIMFVRSRAVAWTRNRLLRLFSVEQLVRSIAAMMEEPV
jgi:2-polyprenyl-6-methoxyphenol hydroxylase-like FAD-dependent oxidoreductase